MYIQKLSPFWWTKNHRYFLYFMREATGPFIAFATLWFLFSAILDPSLAFVTTPSFQIISSIGIFASVFHTITWLRVTVTISPIPLPRWLQIIIFLGLLALWFFISVALIRYLYV